MRPLGVSKIVVCVVVLVILAALLVYWYLRKPAVAPVPSAAVPTGAETLGGQIYTQASNPIQDKLPGTVSPVPNPLEGAYKNPFE